MSVSLGMPQLPSDQPGAPVLRIKGAALFGGVEVKRKPRKKQLGGGSDRPQLPGA